MSDSQRIWVDFMKTDDDRRLRLTARGTLEDLDRLGVQLQEGVILQVYGDDLNDAGDRDDLLAEGIVERNVADGTWVLAIDWTAVRHRSQE